MSQQKISELLSYRTSALFSETEKLVLNYADAMTQTPMLVTDEMYAKLQSHFSEPQMVELTAAIAWENYRARFDHAFGLESEGFSEGEYCAVTTSAQVE